MKIYHGGYTEIQQPKIIKGKFAKDFGIGFYCTNLEEQVIRWAKRFDTSVISIFESTHFGNLNVLNFEEMTDKWLEFIVDCRSWKKHEYDIVIGPMANDQIYNYIADYIAGVINKKQFWVLADFKRPTHQIAFCSKKSLQFINFVESYRV